MPCRCWGLDGLSLEFKLAAVDVVCAGHALVSVRMRTASSLL